MIGGIEFSIVISRPQLSRLLRASEQQRVKLIVRVHVRSRYLHLTVNYMYNNLIFAVLTGNGTIFPSIQSPYVIPA